MKEMHGIGKDWSEQRIERDRLADRVEAGPALLAMVVMGAHA